MRFEGICSLKIELNYPFKNEGHAMVGGIHWVHYGVNTLVYFHILLPHLTLIPPPPPHPHTH